MHYILGSELQIVENPKSHKGQNFFLEIKTQKVNGVKIFPVLKRFCGIYTTFLVDGCIFWRFRALLYLSVSPPCLNK